MNAFKPGARLGGALAIWAAISTATAADSSQTNPRPTPPLPPPVPARATVTTRIVGTNAPGNNPPPVAPGSPAFPAVHQPLPPRQNLPPLPLIWDAETKEYQAKPGDTNAYFVFYLTNNTPEEIVITQVRTSCGCTVAKVPATPWKLAPGTNGQIEVTVNLQGKRGLVVKTVSVYSTAYTGKNLTVKVDIPEPMAGPMGDRSRNLQIATADRQAVFRGDCAQCHAAPAAGKKGAELFTAVCGVCHEAEHRASMVPDLRNLNHSTDRIYWKVWAAQGKQGSLMPGFSKSVGGPLTDEQIESLADFLADHIPSRPVAADVAPGAK
jgi:mono/diheme cytochrome c family protein